MRTNAVGAGAKKPTACARRKPNDYLANEHGLAGIAPSASMHGRRHLLHNQLIEALDQRQQRAGVFQMLEAVLG